MKKKSSSVLFFTLILLLSINVSATENIGIPKADSLIVLSEQTVDPNKKLVYWIQIITILTSESRWDLTETYADAIIELATEVGDHRKVVFGMLQKSLLYTGKAEYKTSIEYFNKTYAFANSNGVTEYNGHIYGNLGSIYYTLENYESSLDYQIKAFDLVKQDSNYYLMSYVALIIGDLYRKLSQYDKAFIKYHESLRYSRKAGDSHRTSSNAAAISVLHTDRNELDSALFYIQYGWKELGDLRPKEAKFNLYRAEYEWHYKKENYEEALEKELLAKAIIDDLHTEDELYSHALNMARVYEKLNKTEKAINYANEALEAAHKTEGKQKLANCYSILASAYEKRNAFQKAYAAQKKWQTLNDSIHNEKLIMRFEKMEVDNAILQQKVADQLLLEKEAVRNQRLVWSLIALGIMATLIALGGFVFYRLNNRNFQTSERLASANNMLRIKSSELKKSNDNLQHFSFSLSHDILVQLDRIISFTGLQKQFQEENNNKLAEEYLDKTQLTSSALKVFCLDLITYFRLSQHNEMLEEIELNEVFDSVFEGMEENTKISLHLEKEKLPTVIANEKQMYRIFQNLLSNAVKFKKEGNFLQLKLTATENKENHIISFSDNGKGIAASQLESIFKPFIRADVSVEGSGLGLPICKKIIENLGGKIWVESKIGEGATFFISFPK